MQQKKPSNNFAEPLRAKEFKTDPGIWNKECERIVSTLALKMADDQLKLFDIYEEARKERMKVAQALHHGNEFGLVRTERSRDIYKVNDIDLTDERLFQALSKLISAQNEFFDMDQNNNSELFVSTLHTTDDWIWSFSSDYDLDAGTEKVIKMETWWPRSDENSYKEYLELLNPTYQNIRRMDNTDKLLFTLGLLSYDLSRPNLLKRGSAAVTLYISFALGRRTVQDFRIPNLHDLPFDIYAQVQLNRHQYAIDFARSIKSDFKEHPEYMTLSIIERRYLKFIIQTIDATINSNNAEPLINQSTYNFKKILERDWVNLPTALIFIGKEIDNLDDHQRKKLSSIRTYLSFAMSILQQNHSTAKQRACGYFVKDGQSLILTKSSIDDLYKKSTNNFLLKEKNFVDIIIGAIQKTLGIMLTNSPRGSGNIKFLNDSSTNNPLDELYKKIQQIKNKEWPFVLEALIAVEEHLDQFLKKGLVKFDMHSHLFCYADNLKLIINRMRQQEPIESIILLKEYHVFSYPLDLSQQLNDPKDQGMLCLKP